MFHRACQSSAAELSRVIESLRIRIADLESQNERLIDKMMEEREASAARETDLSDRILALANPMAARVMGVGSHANRPTSPAPAPPVVGRPPADRGMKERERTRGPLLSPRPGTFRPLADVLALQKMRAAAVAKAAFGGKEEGEGEGEAEVTAMDQAEPASTR